MLCPVTQLGQRIANNEAGKKHQSFKEQHYESRIMNCRNCKTPLKNKFVDLDYSPPSNQYIEQSNLSKPEVHYPLRVFVCTSCWLVQTEDIASAESMFSDEYAYFSSTSSSWLLHAERYSEQIIEELTLDSTSHVVEIASNDGYLLKNFVQKNIPCLGIEPTKSTAEVAEKLSIPVLKEFFSEQLAKELVYQSKSADLICGNNVYAHVPDIVDFTKGMKVLLKENGTITLEFPHLFQLITKSQFDTIYHEHFSYLSLIAVENIFQTNGLRIYKVEELSTHGGSLRVFGCHEEDSRLTEESVGEIKAKEESINLNSIVGYQKFQSRVDKIKHVFLEFLLEKNNAGDKIAGLGAAAKGNTLMNYSGVKSDLISSIYDNAKAKQGKYAPGSHIQIKSTQEIEVDRPDWMIVFPWNIAEELVEEQKHLKSSGTRFVSFVPEIKFHN